MGVLTMNDKERERKAIFEMVQQGKLTLRKAAIQCGLSYRQALRVFKAYCSEGDTGLIHGYRGRPSNRKNPHRSEIIKRYQEKYEGFGPTLAAEYLEKEGYNIHHETLRLWLLEEQLWSRHRKRSPYRKYRERKAQFGELVQIDGSIHDWFGVGQHQCLLNFVDDATGKTLSRLADGETTRVLFEVMWDWINRYGIPLAVYVDLKSTYVSPREDGLSHFQCACQKLGVRVIKAYSPQAKGRVEREHAVYQDRFVKELLVQDIKTIDDANKVLCGGFVDALNEKFEKPARISDSAHRPLMKLDLNQVFCWEYVRQIQRDWTFALQGRHYQIHKKHGEHLMPKTQITVRKHLNGCISAWYEKRPITFEALEKRSAPLPKIKTLERRNSQTAVLRPIPAWRQADTFCYQPTHSSAHKFTLRVRGH